MGCDWERVVGVVGVVGVFGVVGVVGVVRSSRIITYYSQFYSYVYPHKIWNWVSNVVTLQSETKKIHL